MSVKARYPATFPVLNLDFANAKRLDPRINFSRASSASYFDRDGYLKLASSGAPRFDHDPATYESKGLLIEEQRTNLLTYSEQFDNSAWGLLGGTDVAVTANSAVAPDGTTTADKLYEATTNSTVHGIQIVTAPTVTAGAAVTASVFFKAAERSFVRLQVIDGVTTANTFYAYFDLSGSGAASSITVGGAATAGSAVIQNVGNGWYRASVSGVTGVSDTRPKVTIYLQTALVGSASYAGTAGSGLYIWGAQLEAGSFPTSYIPTTSAQVTRAADVSTMTGTNFSSWYNQSEGTLFAEFSAPNTETTTRIVAGVNDGTTSEWLLIAKTVTNRGSYEIYDGGVAQVANQSAAGNLVSTLGKCAFAYKQNDFATATNGLFDGADNAGTLPTVSQMNIGDRATGGRLLNGHIKRIAYFPKRLSNTELQALTS